jgi:hypothetical protein
MRNPMARQSASCQGKTTSMVALCPELSINPHNAQQDAMTD